MSSDDKLQITRLVAFGLAIIAASMVYAYSADLSEMLISQTSKLLGDSFSQLDAIAKR